MGVQSYFKSRERAGVNIIIINPKHDKEQLITLNFTFRALTVIAICRLKVAGRFKQRIRILLDFKTRSLAF